MSGMRGGLTKLRDDHGDYWKLEFDVCIDFGGVELTAHLEWKEKVSIERVSASKPQINNSIDPRGYLDAARRQLWLLDVRM